MSMLEAGESGGTHDVGADMLNVYRGMAGACFVGIFDVYVIPYFAQAFLRSSSVEKGSLSGPCSC